MKSATREMIQSIIEEAESARDRVENLKSELETEINDLGEKAKALIAQSRNADDVDLDGINAEVDELEDAVTELESALDGLNDAISCLESSKMEDNE